MTAAGGVPARRWRPVPALQARAREPFGAGLLMPVVAPVVAGVGVLLAALAAPAAHAAEAERSNPTAPVVDAPVAPFVASGPARPLWEVGLGIAGLRLPDYRGSNESRSVLLPLPYVVYRGRFLRADRDGARAVLVDAPRFELDLSVAASVPTESGDNAARRGMADLPATVEIGPNANLHLWAAADSRFKLDLRLPLRAAVSVERAPKSVGATFSPNLNLDVADVAGWNVGLLAGPLYGNHKYHALFYEVDAADAAPERPAYRSRGGYAGWRALAATSRRFGSAWAGAFVRYDSVAGAVFEQSPLVRRRDAVTVGFGVSWVLRTSAELVSGGD